MAHDNLDDKQFVGLTPPALYQNGQLNLFRMYNFCGKYSRVLPEMVVVTSFWAVKYPPYFEFFSGNHPP